MKYCESIYQTKRWKTREVLIGKVGIGGNHPIRIQSMTTSNTRDVLATIEQIMRLSDAGCEIARITVQGMKEAESCGEIKNGLVQKGYEIPLVADIHFYPPAAMRVADFVDKVRINPGNFVDRRATFKILEYSDASYLEELQRIEEGFTPLVQKCRTLGRALRIGTNHGSLSDRIMNRYGDTPKGMVESALEFARVCRKLDFHNFCFSMKASNPLVMIQAYRLLVAEMIALGWDYPLHLGVTEAGEGEDGRVKSAIGIGALLLDGIGDTIRVSLTEDPWEEIDPCKRLVSFAEKMEGRGDLPFEELHRDISQISRRPVTLPESPKLHRDGSVILSQLEPLKGVDLLLSSGLPQDVPVPLLTRTRGIPGTVPLLQLTEQPRPDESPFAYEVSSDGNWEAIALHKPAFIFLAPESSRLHFSRRFFEWICSQKIDTPVILSFSYPDLSWEDLVIQASAELGALLADRLGEGICIQSPHPVRDLSFNILQGVRMRTSKTEYISCPGCGRTLFELQAVAKRIREQTGHLPGVKIAIMGCIVNGPGEMADADFGYVGSKPGKVDLYVGKTCVERDIDFADADKRLIDLIKAHGRWVSL
ncbi:MAG: (E)-4-hydroxy-3-methylbut-2-enyl-diphosphate synthase [Verrucomicrobia bacterium]|nr:(E)-4-hydroxy-3-methylbut-2-enyl-diphosphate synthase [Verrucomicrobiota bacterium]